MALDRLKEIRGEVTLEQLSEDTGISVSQLSRYETGKRDPSLAHLQALASRFRVEVQDLIGRAVVRRIPVVGSVGAGGAANFEPLPGDDELEADAPEGTVAVRIRGASLGPGFDGWYALYNERFDPFHDGLIGHLCVIETADDRRLIKWVRRSPGRGVNLVSGTGDIEEDVEVLRAARVIDLRPS